MCSSGSVTTWFRIWSRQSGICRARARHARCRNQCTDRSAGRPGPGAQAAENLLTEALRQLFALSEAYPNLKADSNFRALQAALTDIEDKLASARRAFNNAVQRYNTGVQQFPTIVFASTFGFIPHEFFDMGDDRRLVQQSPQVKF